MAFANEKIFVAVVEKNVVLFIDTNVLAESRFAHLPAYAVRIGSRRKCAGGGQRASGSRHDRELIPTLRVADSSGVTTEAYGFQASI
jgi:hypothetical protein